MPFYTPINKRAQKAADDSRKECLRLHQKIKDLEKEKAEAEAALQLARSAIQRFDNFNPNIGGDLLCPDCWIYRDISSILIPIPSETDADLFRCKTCHMEISV